MGFIPKWSKNAVIHIFNCVNYFCYIVKYKSCKHLATFIPQMYKNTPGRAAYPEQQQPLEQKLKIKL